MTKAQLANEIIKKQEENGLKVSKYELLVKNTKAFLENKLEYLNKKSDYNAYATYPKLTFEEFREDYEGFDWENGEIVFIAKSNAAHFCIWNNNSQWRVMAERHFDKAVINWRHTENTMVITLDM